VPQAEVGHALAEACEITGTDGRGQLDLDRKEPPSVNEEEVDLRSGLGPPEEDL
jgi:hypothetical protein